MTSRPELLSARRLPTAGLARALNFGERRSARRALRGADADHHDTCAPKLAAWSERVAPGAPGRFPIRLGLAGLELATAPALFVDPDPALLHEHPWIRFLEQAREQIWSLHGRGDDAPLLPFMNATDPLPFEEIMLGFVVAATNGLPAAGASEWRRLSPRAVHQLQHSLLARLVMAAVPVLDVSWTRFCGTQRSGIRRGPVSAPASDQRVLYRRFCTVLRGDALGFIFKEFPVLARMLSEISLQWVNTTTTLLARLDADWPLLSRTFFGGRDAGPAIALETDLSDSHGGGGSVVRLEFANASSIIYKPKDIAMERAFFDFLATLPSHGLACELRTPVVLPRSGYGWAEAVTPLEVTDESDAKLYFYRAGVLICATWMLCGTDGNSDNLLACGAHPVLVDAETLLHPEARSLETFQHPSAFVTRRLRDSVLATGLVPTWFRMTAGTGLDPSGLGGTGDQRSLYRVFQVRDINSDAMRLELDFGKLKVRANAPRHAGRDLSPLDYIDVMEAGFRAAYGAIQANKASVRKFLLAEFGGLEGRFLLRSTPSYALLLQRSTHPSFMRCGAEHNLLFETLYAGRLEEFAARPALAGIVAGEIEALLRRDIPMFHCTTDSTSLILEDGSEIADFFEQSGLDRALDRLDQLGGQGEQEQVEILRMAVHGRFPIRSAAGVDYRQANSDEADTPPLTREELVKGAEAITDEIQAHALPAPEGRLDWIALSVGEPGQRIPEGIGLDLYDGAVGVAFFVSALFKVTADPRHAELAHRILQPLVAILRQTESRDSLLATAPIGGAAGLGSLVYALVQISGFLADRTLLEAARVVADAVTPDGIEADRSLDVIQGAAGAILGLVPLYEATGDQSVLASCRRCGDHLLMNGELIAGDGRYWHTLFGRRLAGFSHGSAGISYALLRLFGVTGDERYLRAAEEGIRAEDSMFDVGRRNWPDRRTDVDAFMSTWCHGATGIGLARLGGLEYYDEPQVRADIEIAIERTLETYFDDFDQLCCGTSGRTEFLLEAGLRLGRGELVSQARRLHARLCRDAVRDGFCLETHAPRSLFRPGLFLGMAGIGYTMLRLAAPAELPCVLLWESRRGARVNP